MGVAPCIVGDIVNPNTAVRERLQQRVEQVQGLEYQLSLSQSAESELRQVAVTWTRSPLAAHAALRMQELYEAQSALTETQEELEKTAKNADLLARSLEEKVKQSKEETDFLKDKLTGSWL